MRMFIIILSALGGLAQNVGGTEWEDVAPFKRPDTFQGVCSQAQRSGYDWSGLPDGPFTAYGNSIFQGWRVYRTLSAPAACIVANLEDGPSITTRHGDTMSVDVYRMSSAEYQVIEFEYEMLDGSFCREYHPSSPTVANITNRQCGGARSVKFWAHNTTETISDIVLHSIDFYCGDRDGPQLHSSSNASSTKEDQVERTGSVYSSDTSPRSSSATNHHSVQLDRPTSTPGRKDARITDLASTATVRNSRPVVTGPHTASSNHLRPSALSAPLPHPVALSAPVLLPKCLNTWIQTTPCQNAADYVCFCSFPRFIDRAMQCIASWCTSDEDAWDAVSPLIMMCASDLINHPDIVKAFPSYMGYSAYLSSAAPMSTELVTSTVTIRSTKTVQVQAVSYQESHTHLPSLVSSHASSRFAPSPGPLSSTTCASTGMNLHTNARIASSALEYSPPSMGVGRPWLPWQNLSLPYTLPSYIPHETGNASNKTGKPASSTAQFVSGTGRRPDKEPSRKTKRLVMGLTVLMCLLLP